MGTHADTLSQSTQRASGLNGWVNPWNRCSHPTPGHFGTQKARELMVCPAKTRRVRDVRTGILLQCQVSGGLKKAALGTYYRWGRRGEL